MTLLEMSRQYAADAEVFDHRIRYLQRRAVTTSDDEQRRQLLLRIAELRPLLRQSRTMAYVTAHYYDREAYTDA